MAEVSYSVKAAAQRTGLSPHVIRMWEKRYAVVQPNRTGSNRRRYSEAEVDRLALLRAATQAGHSIGQIATLDETQLRRLAVDVASQVPPAGELAPTVDDVVDEAIAQIRQLNAAGLENRLAEAAGRLGTQGVLQKVIVPLTYRVGELWQKGEVTAAEEHFASSHIRTFLGAMTRPYVLDPDAPLLVTGTPVGQHHELGAIIVGAAASSLGWRVANLASGLPAAEIASAAIRGSARAVALSVVYPEDDPKLPDELRMLRRMLPAETEVLIGGRAASAYRSAVDEIGARFCDSCDHFCEHINELRRIEN